MHPPHHSIHAPLFLLFLFMFLNQGCACGKYRRKGQEEPAHQRTVLFSYYPGGGRDHSAQDKAGRILVPLRLTERGSINFDSHYGLSPMRQSPNETTNHNGITPSVTQSALKGCRIRIQLTTEA